MTILDDPKQDRRAEVLLHLPALEGLGEVGRVFVLDEEVDALGREFTLTGLQEGEDGVATFDGVGVLDQR